MKPELSSIQPEAASDADPATGPVPSTVLAIDLDPAIAELVALWLAAEGWRCRRHPVPGESVSLILIEVAFPRTGECDRLKAAAVLWPGVPVILLSPTFFHEVPMRGELAHELGVAAVLATPLAQAEFLAAVRGVVGRAR